MARSKSSEGQPRRRPSGSQGHAIVQALLEAARRILERDGVDALTTNRIAEDAGVSIGSFYQYFPDKQALLAELARALELRTVELVQARLSEVPAGAGERVTAATEVLIDIVLSDELGDIALRQVLQQRIAPAWVRDTSSKTDASVRELVRGFLISNRAEIAADIDPEVAAFVLVNAVEAIAEAAVREGAIDHRKDELRAALRRLVLRYLGVGSDPFA